jgi:hypothetical protein
MTGSECSDRGLWLRLARILVGTKETPHRASMTPYRITQPFSTGDPDRRCGTLLA